MGKLVQQISCVHMLELAADHLCCQVVRIEDTVIVDAHWHDLDIEFQFTEVLE
jgi:hypothetical protein